MSIKEALGSTEPAKIRAGCGAAKGQVTKNLNKLREGLLVENDKFLHNKINEKVVLKSAQKLDTAYDQFIDLHERFLVFRTAEADNNAEKESLKKEGKYVL